MSNPVEMLDPNPNRLPEANVQMLDESAFKIQLERLAADSLYDQGVATATGQGCISSPSGPTC